MGGWNSLLLYYYYSLQITTTSLRVKEVTASRDEGSEDIEEGVVSREGRDVILYEFPLFRISYCGTNETLPEAFSFVAKDIDEK